MYTLTERVVLMSNITFNEKALTKIFHDIYMVTGVRVSVFEPPIRYSLNDAGFHFFNCVSYPPTMPPCFCRSVRKCKKVDELCFNCDNDAIRIVENTKKTYIYTCHFGFKEALIPILINGNVMAICFIGQLKNSIGFPDFTKLCDKIIHIDPDFFEENNREELFAEFNSMRIMSDDSIVSLCNLLERFMPVCVENGLISISKSSLTVEFAYYVQKNIDKHIKLSDITDALNISQAHLCRLVKNEFGMSFTEYVNDLKIKKAKSLLAESDYSITEIAQGLGFDDTNYFSRLFKKMTGENARTYRKKAQKSGINAK